VQAISRCLLVVGEESNAIDRCRARAERLCAGAATRRDAEVARTAARTTRRCEAVPLVDALGPGGLGFAALATTCPAGPAVPGTGDLIACVLERARCLGERTVAESVPRAYELLSELDADPDEAFPCVVDPDELGSPSGAFTAS
jgi:hypothetical protein